MVGGIGAQLLAETTNLEFGELCVGLQKDMMHSAGRLLHVPKIDRILSLALDFSTPISAHNTTQQVAQSPSRLWGPVIEITSMNTASGKTHIVYYLSALCTLPAYHHGVSLSGKSSAVLVFDTDGRFDVHRLRAILRSHILHCFEAGPMRISAQELDNITQSALDHVHIFRPQSSRSMVEMLKGTATYLLNLGIHKSSQRRLDAILVDGMSAFYWQDRFNWVGTEKGVTGSLENYDLIVHYLRALSTSFGAFIVSTNWGLHINDAVPDSPEARNTVGTPITAVSPASPAFRSHLPSCWAKFVDVKLILERSAPTTNRREVSTGKGMQKRNATQLATKQHEICGWVDIRGLSIRAQVLLKDESTTFHMKIDGDRIEFE
ncbi:hypothetical protein FN846DRAFT_70185 [Sphaerosporella brunnea]|uniref:DNA recombination and repair protein Rad51-like C-terminal domain-containing protein n=1 Tax=Sphaerosporella brunnea TaxID=1250544 RepID=A0A5J5EUK4_9PEZI|nr:hypothetical protein FN846DRAFT_70185 [Sphaerosporella brunnea]